MDKAIEPIRVSNAANNQFWKALLTTADTKNAVVIKNLDLAVENYGKTGMPLEYKRVDFVKDLQTKLEKISEEKRAEILKKLEIELQPDTYEGFINLKTLDRTNPEEAEIQTLCEKFLLNNKIITENPQLDEFLNAIIKGMPELVNIIGKKQHGTHNYTLDGHTLKVLKEVVSNPQFETLSNQDKMIAQLMALLHDIGKKGGVIDRGHEFLSSIMANDILEKINLPEFTKKRIVELIKNHNWLQQLNLNEIDHKTVAVMFRNPEDIKIAKIFAEADLKGVSSSFYDNFSTALSDNIGKMNDAMSELYSTGNMLFPTRILNINKIPTVTHTDGHQYKVLNIATLPEDTDLFKYGLSVKNKKDLRLIFHAGDFEIMQSLQKPFNESVICTTMISPDKKATYYGKGIGMMLDTTSSNVINSSSFNQGSGCGRDFYSFVKMSSKNNHYRAFQRKVFLQKLFLLKLLEKYNLPENALSKNDYEIIYRKIIDYMQYDKLSDFKLSDGTIIKANDLKALKVTYNNLEENYAKIYKQIVDKKYLEQIHDIKLSDGTIIKADDLKEAYKEVEKMIMANTDRNHNEINIYNPQLKGAILIGDSLEEIAPESLKFIREHNLPIFIMGKYNYLF